MKQRDAVERLSEVYRETPQIGLVLGAGVSADSGVPLFADLALQLFERANAQGRLRDVPESIITLLREHGLKAACDPDKVVQYLYEHLDRDESLPLLVKQALYSNVETKRSHNMVGSRTYRDNVTLDAVISFCAAPPGSPLAPESQSRWETNPKVGAILTTNYDNLLEGAFGTKYGRSLLKPVAREEARESMPGKRVIPVYHMHGYVSYVDDPHAPDGVKASELVIAEEDYYRTYYNLLGFSNVVATSVLRQFPCLFIGSSMADPNPSRVARYRASSRSVQYIPQRSATSVNRSRSDCPLWNKIRHSGPESAASTLNPSGPTSSRTRSSSVTCTCTLTGWRLRRRCRIS